MQVYESAFSVLEAERKVVLRGAFEVMTIVFQAVKMLLDAVRLLIETSVGDPDPEPVPDPQDPHVFGPPGSGSTSQSPDPVPARPSFSHNLPTGT